MRLLSSLCQHTATHCNTLQHTAAHYNTLHHTDTHCNRSCFCSAGFVNTLQHTAAQCNTLHHTATHCITLQHTATGSCFCSAVFGTYSSTFSACEVCRVSEFRSVLQCVAVCCSVSQCVAVCRSVSQCVAVCSRAFPACEVCRVSEFHVHCMQNIVYFVRICLGHVFVSFCRMRGVCNVLSNTLQHTVIHSNTLQHTVTHCRALRHSVDEAH